MSDSKPSKSIEDLFYTFACDALNAKFKEAADLTKEGGSIENSVMQFDSQLLECIQKPWIARCAEQTSDELSRLIITATSAAVKLYTLKPTDENVKVCPTDKKGAAYCGMCRTKKNKIVGSGMHLLAFGPRYLSEDGDAVNVVTAFWACLAHTQQLVHTYCIATFIDRFLTSLNALTCATLDIAVGNDYRDVNAPNGMNWKQSMSHWIAKKNRGDVGPAAIICIAFRDEIRQFCQMLSAQPKPRVKKVAAAAPVDEVQEQEAADN